MEGKIRANYIFEILGRPPEHITSSLNVFIDKLGEIEGVRVLNKKVHEPKLFEEGAKGLYSTFGEAELEINNVETAFTIVFNMLPCSVEILEPAEIRLKNVDLGQFISELAVKLHRYDELMKGLVMERDMFARKLNEIQEKINRARDAQARRMNGEIPLRINSAEKDQQVKKKSKKIKKK